MERKLLIGPRGTAWRVDVPETRRERMRGLRGGVRPPPGRGLLFERARSIHTFGMRYAITAAFLDADLRIVRALRLPPRRVVIPRRRVRHVLECGEEADLRVGDLLLVRVDGRALAEGRAASLPDERPEQQTEEPREERSAEHGDRDAERKAPANPGRKRDRLSAAPVGRDDPERFQEDSHPQ